MSGGLTRRGALTTVGSGAALGGLALNSSVALGANSPAAPDVSPTNLITGKLNSWLADNPLFNRENATKVLKEAGVDALLVSGATNLFHLTAVKPITNTMMPVPPEAYALLTADPLQPVRLLQFDFGYYFMTSDERPGSWLETRLYAGPASDEPDAPAREPMIMRAPPWAELTPDEKRRRDEVNKMLPEMATSAAAGLVQMLRDAGLTKGRIACDSVTAAEYCEKASLDLEFIDAHHVAGLIRRVKSPIEIDLMRYAANQNALAATAAVQGLRGGVPLSELRKAYFIEAANRGGHSDFMAINRATSQRYDRSLEDGQAFMIDGVSSFAGYHGDFGRTVFLGEPNRRMAAVVAEIQKGWQAIRARMVPGATYGELLEIGASTLRNSTMDLNVRFNVHSVGLWHTDDPFGQPYEDWLATKLQPDMILSVDCVLFDEGIGGTAHYEDLTLITEQGPVILHTEFPAALMV